MGRCGLEPAPSSCLRSPLLVAGVAPITASGDGSLSSHEDGGTLAHNARVLLASETQRLSRRSRLAKGARPGPLFLRRRADAVRSGVSVRLTVRVEEKVIDLVSRRDRLPSAPFTPGSSYTPCAVASRRRGARNDPKIGAGADGRMVFAKTHRAITSSRHEDGPPRALRSRHTGRDPEVSA